jgi:O-antigen/teichoic acid export membrane protein
MSASEPTGARPPARDRGLTYVLGATVVAGAIGYVIQAVVPAFTGTDEYIAFSVFWSVVYLIVSALSGIQNELTRAAHPTADRKSSGWRTLWGFAGVAAAVAVLAVVASSPLWAPRVFAADTVMLVAAVAVATLGYTMVAVLSGALYGVRNWPAVASMTIGDSALRLIAVTAALALGGGMVALGWAVAVPFLLAFVGVLAMSARSIRATLHLDARIGALGRNSLTTVAAAAATGLMISGLPFLLGLTSPRTDGALLASLILVITLTRAPLVIPLLALQSYLVVTFRDDAHDVRRRVLRLGGALLALTAVLSVLAVIVGPWIIALLYGDRYELPAAAYALIVASAGLTGLLCITGPAVLAAGRHGVYLAGWAVASAVLVGGLLLPWEDPARVLTAILAAPVAGVLTHAGGSAVRRRRTGGGPSAGDAERPVE